MTKKEQLAQERAEARAMSDRVLQVAAALTLQILAMRMSKEGRS